MSCLQSGGGRSILFGVAKEDAPWCPGTTAHERGRGGRDPQAPVAPGVNTRIKLVAFPTIIPVRASAL
jgi:hypothetical protein